MKRRVISLITVLALCLNLCPAWGLASDQASEDSLCPHHRAHTETCGYVPPTPEQNCSHEHDENCFVTETLCVHQHTEDCSPDPETDLCGHVCSEDSGCVTVTPSCTHVHGEACGYAPESPGAPCTFACRVCPVEDLIDKLPRSVTQNNQAQAEEQLSEILALYSELTAEEQEQLDLSRCLDLQTQLDAAYTTMTAYDQREQLGEDHTYETVNIIDFSLLYDLNGYAYKASKTAAFQVENKGELYLTGSGSITASKGSAVEVRSGGYLSVEDPGLTITGKTAYGLDIASGAKAQLSGGTFIGRTAAICTADGNFKALLKDGYAFFDESGNPIALTNVASAKTVSVKECTAHSYSYTHNTGFPTHSWTCAACGKSVSSEPCTFSFGEDGTAECESCKVRIAIAIDEASLGDLIYNGNEQPGTVTLTVTLNDGTKLVETTDYMVECSTRSDVGEITVTVTGKTYNGTFTKTYHITQNQPAIEWDTTDISVPVEVDYTGNPVDEAKLPKVKITAPEDLREYIQYSYKKVGDTDLTDGLPVNAGDYEIKASLPEQDNYKAAETNPCLKLTINKIPALKTAPTPTQPTYNGTAQELVTAGEVENGAEILFARSENGSYSAEIPTGINAGDYEVWYKVEGTDNYIGVSETEIADVLIQRKPVTPIVVLSSYKYLYDGGYKEPTVTVKDDDNVTVLPDTEYSVSYVNNRNVGTATVKVTGKPGGNYAIADKDVDFNITLLEQATLSITNKPNTVTYGDKFTLSTSGGSGNGDVTWEITKGAASVNRESGQVTITGHGEITVQATKSGTYGGVTNYEDAIAVWTFTADKKPVTAVVTAENKTYDGGTDATIHAVVEQGVLPGDQIIIDDLSGDFDDENAGTNKTVTVDISGAKITGTNSEHYAVTYSSTSVRADITKAIVKIDSAPVPASLTYNGTAQALIETGAVLDTAGVKVEYALSENGPYSADIPEETNAGKYEVWYRVQETNNHTGTAAVKVDVEIEQKPVNDPKITLTPSNYPSYDGTAKEPAVTVEDDDGSIIPASEYTVQYSNNVNAGTDTATVTVTAKTDGNYTFGAVTKTFSIGQKQAQVLTAPEPAGEPLTFNTKAQKLVTAGTASGGTMVYSLTGQEGSYSSAIPAETNAADYTVYYKVEGDGNHADSAVESVQVTISPKRVTNPIIDLSDDTDSDFNANGYYIYNGSARTPKVAVYDNNTLIDDPDNPTEYKTTYLKNKNAGDATVNITNKPGGNYTVSGSTTFLIVEADINDPEPEPAVLTYNGEAQQLLKECEADGGVILYSLSKTGKYTEEIPTGTNAGKYTVWYKVEADANHNDFTATSVDVTIARKELTAITIELTPNSFEYDGNPHMPSVTVKDGNTVLPESEYNAACSPQNPTDKGTYTVTISDEAGGNYDLSTVTSSNTAEFEIGKTAQEKLVIDHTSVTATNYGDKFTLTTTGGTGNGAVTWKATGPVTVDNDGNVEITGVGDVTITATKAADTDNYAEAIANWSFTAAPRPVEATVTVKNKAYDGNTSAEIDTITVLTINGDTVTVEKTSLIATFEDANVGANKKVILNSSNVTVTGAAAAKYDISYPDSVTAAISQATTTITNPTSKAPLTYNGQPQELVTAGTSNVGNIEYSLNGTDFANTVPTGTNTGKYTIYSRVVGNTNYTDAAGTPIDVTIAPKTVNDPKIELSETSFLYDGTKKEPKITVKDGNTVIDSDQYTITWDKNQTDEGTHTLTIQNKTGANYTFTGKNTAEIKIEPAVQGALKITGKPTNVYYGDTITTLDTTGGSGNGTVTWSITTGGTNSNINVGTGELTIKDTGTITVTAERTVLNYGTVSDTWTFTVKPKPVTAVVTVASKDYDGNDTANITKAEVNSSDLVNSGDSVTITGLTGTYDDANVGTNKTVTLDSSGASADNTGKYSVSYPATVKANINPKSVTVTVTLSGDGLTPDSNGDYYDYDGTAKTPAVTVTEDGGATLSDNDYSVSYSKNTNVGIADVTVTAKAGGNYTFPEETVHFEIRKGDVSAVLTGSPQAKDLTYTGQPQELVTVGTATGGKVVYSLAKDGTYSETIPQKTDAGTYTVYYKVKGDGNHTDTAVSQVSVTIKPKQVISPVITVSPASVPYDGTAQTPAVTVKDNGQEISGDEYAVTYRDNINAGTATVEISSKNGSNYIISGTAAFEITKIDPTFTAPTPNTTVLQYNGTAQQLVQAGSSNDGTMLYSLDGANYSETIPTGTAVDTYTVSYKVRGDSNHNDSVSSSMTVKIEKNTVTSPTITLSSDTFRYDGSQQKPTVTVYDNSSRLIPGNEYVVTYSNANNPSDTQMVNVGTYTVTIAAATNSNYNFTGDLDRTFKIVEADQEVLTITGMRGQVYYGDIIQLGTTGGTGNGTVTWAVTDSASGNTVRSTITSSGLLTVKDIGTSLKVTAKRNASSGNYSEASATWEFTAGKKPVTAVLTGVDREYIPNNTTATVKAKVNSSDLVSGDSITILDLNGTFEDENVGTNKKITITSSPTLDSSSTNADRYDITYPATTTASITPKAATVDTAPSKKTLIYTGLPQQLVTPGTATGGNVAYSLNGSPYTLNVPTATDAGKYEVWYKVLANENYMDSTPQLVNDAEIGVNHVTNLEVKCSPNQFQFDGSQKTPTIILKDDDKNVIPESEYTIDFPQNRIAVGTYTVTVTDKNGGNYDFTGSQTATFTIDKASQNPFSIITDIANTVYYGDTFRLSAAGGSGSGTVKWESDQPSIAEIDPASGVVTVKDTGGFTITATRVGDSDYDDSQTDSRSFHADPKPITPIVTAADKNYDGTTNATLSASWKNGDLVGTDTIDVTVTGAFVTADAGVNKQVKITKNDPSGDTGKYIITWPTTTTASIYPVDAKLETTPKAETGLVYNGNARNLITGGTTIDGIGTIEYSLSEKGEYSTDIPTATNAGTYTVWYKVAESVNYTGIGPVAIDVTIAKATPTVDTAPTASAVTSGQTLRESSLSNGVGSVSGSFTWTNGDIVLTNDGLHEVTFTPDDTDNYNTLTLQISVTVNPAPGSDSNTGNNTSSASSDRKNTSSSRPAASEPSAASAAGVQTSVQDGTAVTVVNPVGVEELLQEANAGQPVVIKPEITGDVTKTEVSIPAETVSRLRSETSADLTVSTPAADVTIPNAALDTLSGDVSVLTEQTGQTVSVTLTADGRTVGTVPGGLTLTVPAENAGPGTVAVLVQDDGTRQVIQKSVAENGLLNVPLNGSATVEIVDNSRQFADVPATSWAAGAVAFASAHELFNGTGETTFSPDQTMSRGMLATVLYNLEGRPAQNPTDGFRDVSSGAWYAESVAWAAANGIANGYGDGQFGPNDDVTREQFAVMLWKYAGSPAADGQTLSFTDADQASGYALEALRWAAANGILSGYGDGQLNPGGLTTRAQAAQMLKNFMENT